MDKQCSNINCTLRNECALAQLKSKEKVNHKQTNGDCSNFLPKDKK